MTIDDATLVRLRRLALYKGRWLGPDELFVHTVALPALLKEREKFRARIRELGDGNVERDSAQCDTIARLRSELAAARERAEKAESRVARIQSVVNAQAEDEGLWFVAVAAAEAYLQQELRSLHRTIEEV